MPKEPLITRSELRRRREEEMAASERNQKIVAKQANKEWKQKEKQIDNHYRKSVKIKRSLKRAGENQKSRNLNTFLIKAIVVVALLLIVVALAIFCFKEHD